MALAGQQMRRLVTPPSFSGVCSRQLAVPKQRAQLQRCRATIELPPDLQAELDELEKAAHCGMDGEEGSLIRMHAQAGPK